MTNHMLSISFVSTPIVWENAVENCTYLSSLIEKNIHKMGKDLLLLPEMFSTGFTNNKDAAEEVEGYTFRFMKDVANKYGIAVGGSVATYTEEFDGASHDLQRKYYNRFYFIKPDGSYTFYDKRHVFAYGGEDKTFTGGKKSVIAEWKGAKFMLNVCYDIRFPVASRNVRNSYDILLNIASFPDSRIAVIDPLIKARAIENQAYAIFVNRVGDDPVCHYAESGIAVDFKGNRIDESFESEGSTIHNVNMDIEALKDFREKFPAWADADTFTLN